MYVIGQDALSFVPVEPLDLIAQLAALVPKPWLNLTHFTWRICSQQRLVQSDDVGAAGVLVQMSAGLRENVIMR